MQQRRRWLVSGRVQGVGFRASTREELARCKLDGTASNLADGRVEVTAAGAPEALDRLATWLACGSSYAIVESVDECEPYHTL